MVEDRHESDAGISSYAETQPRNHDVEDCTIDIGQEDRKTRKKEEKGNMDEYGHSSGYPVKVQVLESPCVESTNASSVLRTMPFSRRLKVGLSPLLYEYGKESPGKTHKQAQKPE